MEELRTGFDDVADVYDHIRPTYPGALFDELFSRLPPRADALEVGPGTGQATGALLAHGARVRAVEPGVNLAKRLRSNYEDHDQLQVIVSSLEDVVVLDHSFDAVVAATSLHWVLEAFRLKKPYELLRPDGWMATIDTVQVAASTDLGFLERSQSVYDQYGDATDRPRVPSPEEATSSIFSELQRSTLFQGPLLFRYRWDQTHTSTEYGDLLRSYSTTRSMAEGVREAFVNDMTGFIDEEFEGRVTRPLVITLTMAHSVGMFS
jgi:ubiquinone/menaquinone biosynthesis C-methylase UbiE